MRRPEDKIEPFRYTMAESVSRPSMAESLGLLRMENERLTQGMAAPVTVSAGSSAAPRVDEELSATYAEGRAEGFREGLEQGRREGEKRGGDEALRQYEAAASVEREARKRNAGETLKNFHYAREQYEREIEREAVRLSLAIAARILRREAQMDPLLLTGAVRVALGQLSESSRVTLHVPAVDLPLWQEAAAHLPNLPQRPVVVGDEALEPGACRIEAEMGSVDLSLRSQLAEIERGFFDRVGRETHIEARAGTSSATETEATVVEEGEYLSEEEPVP